MFTGLIPPEHQVEEGHLILTDSKSTLMNFLKEQGYTNIGIASNPLLGNITGLNSGFDEFYEIWSDTEKFSEQSQELRFERIILPGQRIFTETVKILRGLGEQLIKSRLFLFLQFTGPHTPYSPSPEKERMILNTSREDQWRQAQRINHDWRNFYVEGRTLAPGVWEILRQLYQAEISDLVDGLEELFQLPLVEWFWNEGIVIITADHGELLGEHNHFHHVFNLYQEVLHVPLLWHFPAQTKGETVKDLIQHQDLFPAVKQYMIDGTNFLPKRNLALAFLKTPVEILAGLDKLDPVAGDPFRHDQVSVFDGRFKWIAHGHGNHEAYDLQKDPREERNLCLSPGSEFGLLKREADKYLELMGQNRIEHLLKGLGYY